MFTLSYKTVLVKEKRIFVVTVIFVVYNIILDGGDSNVYAYT